MKLTVWHIGTKKIKERTKTPNLIAHHFSLTLVNFDSLNEVLPCIASE